MGYPRASYLNGLHRGAARLVCRPKKSGQRLCVILLLRLATCQPAKTSTHGHAQECCNYEPACGEEYTLPWMIPLAIVRRKQIPGAKTTVCSHALAVRSRASLPSRGIRQSMAPATLTMPPRRRPGDDAPSQPYSLLLWFPPFDTIVEISFDCTSNQRSNFFQTFQC